MAALFLLIYPGLLTRVRLVTDSSLYSTISAIIIIFNPSSRISTLRIRITFRRLNLCQVAVCFDIQLSALSVDFFAMSKI